jgi:DNA-binding response OmpR family regulator
MKKRILVIENDRDIRDVLSLILTEEGYKVSAFGTERDIFNHIRDFEPHVILLDIIKPTLEGTELCRAIKAAETTKHIPVIVLSTHLKIESVKEVCADEVVPKPFDVPQLLKAIEGELMEGEIEN